MSFFKFRKRIKLLPGLWINVSKKGVSLSAGVKGFTVNSRGRTTVSLPGTGLSHVFTSKQRPVSIPNRAQKEANVSALWDKYTEDTHKLENWIPTSLSTPAELEDHIATLRSNKAMLQEDYNAWRTAKDAYLAELKPLVTEESYERVCGHAEDELKDKLFVDLTALENMLYQAKEQATPVDVRFSVTENAPGPPKFHYITPNGEGVMDMFGNVLNVVKSNSLFSAETKKVQNYAKENKNGFVDKMNQLWAEAHTESSAGQTETWDRTAIYTNGKTVNEDNPSVANSGEPSFAKPSTESKCKKASDPAHILQMFLAFLVIAIIVGIASPKSNAPLNQTTGIKTNSTPIPIKESDEQIRADNDAVLEALRKGSSTSSSAPGSAAAVEPKTSPEQIRAENNKILDALRKENSDTTADDELNRAWAGLSQRQRNRLRQAEREWIKQREALPKDEQGEFTNERTSYLRSLGGKN
jgi:uncharacterized protein YecT (DUF1311 family)